MRASALEFRMRFAIMVLLVVLGFWSPWIEAWGLGKRVSLLEWLALELSRLGLLHFTESTPVVIVCGAVVAALGVVLRLWGTAYLGTHVVQNLEMKAGTLRSDGPYRYVRNPLYLGLWCMLAAMSLVMPASGALVSMVLITVFLLRLILAEETFLTARLGEPYTAYLRTVPRLFPRLRSNVLAGNQRPNWMRAVLFELNPIGVFITIAVLAWRYDHLLMMKALVISFGVSLVARALLPRPSDPAPAVH